MRWKTLLHDTVEFIIGGIKRAEVDSDLLRFGRRR